MWCIRFVLWVAATIGRLNFASQSEPFGLLLSAFICVPLFIMEPLLPFIGALLPLFIVPLAQFVVPDAVVSVVVVVVPFVLVVAPGMLLLPEGGIMLLQFVDGTVLGHCTVVAVVGLATVGVCEVVVPWPVGLLEVTGVPGTVFSVPVSEFAPFVTVPVPFGLQWT